MSWRLLKLMSIELMMPSNHLIFYSPLLLLPSIFPNIRVFSNESAIRIRWPKYWSFSFSISPSNEYSGLISHPSTNQARPCLASEIRRDRARSGWYGHRQGLISFSIDWLDLFAVQETLKRLLQHHNLKASFLQCSAFYVVKLPLPYMTTGKIIALTIWTFVGKVMSVLFNILSRFVITLLPWGKCLLISWYI